MARPKKCRRICGMPSLTEFGPRGGCGGSVQMAVDEYEAIRLIDLEGLQQEQAARQMGVARTTAQAIYLSARKKLADCLVNGKMLRIEGGDVEVCGQCEGCGRGCCGRRVRQN